MTATQRPRRATCSEQKSSIKDSGKNCNMFEHITNIPDWHMIDDGTVGKKLAIHTQKICTTAQYKEYGTGMVHHWQCRDIILQILILDLKNIVI